MRHALTLVHRCIGALTAPLLLAVGLAPDARAQEAPGGQVARGGWVGILGNRDVFDEPLNQISYREQLARDQRARTLGAIVVDDPAVRTFTSPSATSDEDYFLSGNGFNSVEPGEPRTFYAGLRIVF